jgi:hypothetical protein
MSEPRWPGTGDGAVGASATPIGFCGLAVASIVLAGEQLGWVPKDQAHDVALALLAIVVPLQAATAIFAMLEGDPVTATASGLLTVTWAAEALVALATAPGTTTSALGLVLLAATAALAVPVAAGVASRQTPMLVVGAAALHFLLGGLYQVTGAPFPRHAGGVVGLAVGLLALSVALALLRRDTGTAIP